MLKIAGVVILYNPDKNIGKNIASYLNNIDKLYVIDNSPYKNSKLLPNNSKIKYIFNNKNLGIATALNMGAKEAIKDGYDFLLTMDQDSKFSAKSLDNLMLWLSKNMKDDIGLISPRHIINIEQQKPKEDIEYPLTVMTSGNIINLKAYKKIGGYKDFLFIDSVDFDYCLNLIDHNYKVIQLNKIELKHELGNIKTEKFLWRNITHSNHNYVRRYYITRNLLYVGKKYKNKYPTFYKQVKREIGRDIIKVILLESDKYKKLRNMLRGYIDYKKGIKGEYKYNN